MIESGKGGNGCLPEGLRWKYYHLPKDRVTRRITHLIGSLFDASFLFFIYYFFFYLLFRSYLCRSFIHRLQ